MNDWIPTISSAIALCGSILALFISTRLAVGRERRQLRWGKELDRLFALEEDTGRLFEDLVSHTELSTETRLRLAKLKNDIGRFGRYPALQSALSDLHNALARLNSVRERHEQDEPIKTEVRRLFSTVLAEIDKLLSK